jgi:AraC family transcriptional regulator
MAQTWGRSPTYHASGTVGTALVSALWQHGAADEPEVYADPSTDHYVVGIALRRTRMEISHDDRVVFNGTAQPGALSIVPLGARPRAVMQEDMDVLHIYLPAGLPIRLLEQSELGSGTVELVDPCLKVDATAQRIGREFLAELRQERPLSRLRVDTLGQDMAIHLIRSHSNMAHFPQSRWRSRGELANWQVKRVEDYLMSNISEDVRLATLADLVGLSTFHFCRAFKASTGHAPHQYQILIRIERAQRLLGTTTLPITEIAAQVGYDDPNQLARMFRRCAGVSPSEYRRKRRG